MLKKMTQNQVTSNKGNVSNNSNKKNKEKKSSSILLHPCSGLIRLEDNKILCYEAIGNGDFLYNFDGFKGISKSYEFVKEWYIEFENVSFKFAEKPIFQTIYSVPESWLISDYLEGTYPIVSGSELFKRIRKFYELILDFLRPEDALHPTIITCQSWLREILNSFMYQGFDANFGAGKTIGLEGMSTICYHGFLCGDISMAGLSRLVSKQKLSLFADELDINKQTKDNELYKIFRQGYRKGNPYVRLKERSYEPDVCDVSGTKGYTFSSDIERALKQRTLVTQLNKTKDRRLPIIDMYLKDLGKELREDIFFWYIENSQKLGSSLPMLLTLPMFSVLNVEALREKLYLEITKNLSEEDVMFLGQFTGRNIELTYNIIIISKIFECSILEDIKQTFAEKEIRDSAFDDGLIINYLIDSLKEKYEFIKGKEEYLLKKGDLKGFICFPLTQFYDNFRIKLRENNLYSIGESRFKQLLKEIGFIENVNVKRERIGEGNPTCLIFDNLIAEKLGVELFKVSEEEVK